MPSSPIGKSSSRERESKRTILVDIKPNGVLYLITFQGKDVFLVAFSNTTSVLDIADAGTIVLLAKY